MEVDSDDVVKDIPQTLPEIDFYLHLLVMIHLLDKQDYEQVSNILNLLHLFKFDFCDIILYFAFL